MAQGAGGFVQTTLFLCINPYIKSVLQITTIRIFFIISLASLKYYLFGLHEALGLNRQWF